MKKYLRIKIDIFEKNFEIDLQKLVSTNTHYMFYIRYKTRIKEIMKKSNITD